MWQFDTDMILHARHLDEAVRSAVEELQTALAPTSIASFSRVELKGNYIQSLLLLCRKVAASSSLSEAVGRIQATGGRKPTLMLASLIQFVSNSPIAPENWTELKGALLTFLDAQVSTAWEVAGSGTTLNDGTECTRAREAPRVAGTTWQATIPRCTDDNTTCRVVSFFRAHKNSLEALRSQLAANSALTSELSTIADVLEVTLTSGEFPWRGNTCRRVGDLLIGLESKAGDGLVTSNHKEHTTLGAALNYRVKIFPLASIRRK